MNIRNAYSSRNGVFQDEYDKLNMMSLKLAYQQTDDIFMNLFINFNSYYRDLPVNGMCNYDTKLQPFKKSLNDFAYKIIEKCENKESLKIMLKPWEVFERDVNELYEYFEDVANAVVRIVADEKLRGNKEIV